MGVPFLLDPPGALGVFPSKRSKRTRLLLWSRRLCSDLLCNLADIAGVLYFSRWQTSNHSSYHICTPPCFPHHPPRVPFSFWAGSATLHRAFLISQDPVPSDAPARGFTPYGGRRCMRVQGSKATQSLQKSLIKEYTLNHVGIMI